MYFTIPLANLCSITTFNVFTSSPDQIIGTIGGRAQISLNVSLVNVIVVAKYIGTVVRPSLSSSNGTTALCGIWLPQQ